MAKEELMEFEGSVSEVLPDARFRVKLDNGHEMIAYTAGKMKKNRIKTIEDELRLRKAIIAKCRWMNAAGLNQGTSGNISARYKDRMLITPSATPYDAMEPDMIASMPLEGAYGEWDGPLQPSTEWRFHLDIMRARPDVGGIVHTHST